MKVVSVFLLAFASSVAFAHSGRTDASGGHNDRKNGGYHFHHGQSAHQHPGGVCPYAATPERRSSPPTLRQEPKPPLTAPVAPPVTKHVPPSALSLDVPPREFPIDLRKTTPSVVSTPSAEPGKAKIAVDEDPTVKAQLRQAENGFAPAQYVVGIRYLTGTGVPADKTKAKHYLELAAKQGHEKSKERLRELRELERK